MNGDPEVKRREFRGPAGQGAMLYDASRSSNFSVPWFEPRYWQAHDAIVGEARGRGRALIVKCSNGQLLLRHYFRGGLVAKLSRDRYLWRGENATRPFHEWRLTHRLHRAGLPVPAPIGARYLRHGATYDGDMLTEFLPQTESLAHRFVAGTMRMSSWIAIGRMLRRFHDFGLCHADLNAHNILLRDEEQAFLIDFDRGSLRKPGLWRDGNLVRLRRSLEKLDDALPASRLSEAEWHSLLSGYREAR
ncbi:MAG: 3-deoxy-D-manno-octulosonic acid kinase [Steroidobacteraceae bacterium]